jgi:hypothetical protein
MNPLLAAPSEYNRMYVVTLLCVCVCVTVIISEMVAKSRSSYRER